MDRVGKRRVLIVEDDADLRNSVATLFERMGWDVLDVENGSVAFSMVDGFEFDLIVSDIRMPGGDGLELVRSLAALQSRRPQVILMTGFTDVSEDQVKAMDGVSALLKKPFNRQQLSAAVNAAIANLPGASERESA